MSSARIGGFVVVAVLATSCQKADEPSSRARHGTARANGPKILGQGPAKAKTAPAKPLPRAHTALRCGECHGKAQETWEASAHANTPENPVYKAYLAGVGGDTASCKRCHEPLEGVALHGSMAIAEGVTCEVCHTMTAIEPKHFGGAFAMDLESNIKYGQLCDLDDHYFHRMGCSPNHEQSDFCGSCHAGQHVPSFAAASGEVWKTEHHEWFEGPSHDNDLPCQWCHMETQKGEVAVGWAEDEEDAAYSDHGTLGAKGDMRTTVLVLGARFSDANDGKLNAHLRIENAHAGHYVPSGLAARRLLVRARFVDAQGTEVDRAEHRLGRFLVDERGDEAPFFRATQVREDNRIPPEEALELDLAVSAPDKGTLELAVVWRQVAAPIAKALEIPIEDVVLVDAAVKVAAPRASGKRRRLPRPIEVKKP